METETLAMAQEIDFSMLALFMRASLTVKIVMILLIVASFWSWSIIVQKFIAYRIARREAAQFDRAFWSGEPLDELFEKLGTQPDGASEKIFVSGMIEWRRSHRQDGNLITGAQARIDRSMDVAIAKQSAYLQGGLPFLATVGSTAPFVGLFGTVWGIKVAFEEIAIAQNTSLAVVAPGIAEALLATGLGLSAAKHSQVQVRSDPGGVDRSHAAVRSPGTVALQQSAGGVCAHRISIPPGPTAPGAGRWSWTADRPAQGSKRSSPASQLDQCLPALRRIHVHRSGAAGGRRASRHRRFCIQAGGCRFATG